jgi:hypothetical protein
LAKKLKDESVFDLFSVSEEPVKETKPKQKAKAKEPEMESETQVKIPNYKLPSGQIEWVLDTRGGEIKVTSSDVYRTKYTLWKVSNDGSVTKLKQAATPKDFN